MGDQVHTARQIARRHACKARRIRSSRLLTHPHWMSHRFKKMGASYRQDSRRRVRPGSGEITLIVDSSSPAN